MQQSIPKHVAIIMDGNGRWAKLKHRPRVFGHAAGRKVAMRVVKQAVAAGVEVLTLFAFGKENWRRPAPEVQSLMNLFLESFDLFLHDLQQQEVSLRFIGERAELSEKVQVKMQCAEQSTASGKRMTLVIAINYSGRWDVLQAMRQLSLKLPACATSAAAGSEHARQHECKTDDEALYAGYLATAGLPDPDLLIRTGGAQRMSNFMLWQLSYTELYFLDVLWPDFAEQHWQAALEFYASQERRFGCTSEQVQAREQSVVNVEAAR